MNFSSLTAPGVVIFTTYGATNFRRQNNEISISVMLRTSRVVGLAIGNDDRKILEVASVPACCDENLPSGEFQCCSGVRGAVFVLNVLRDRQKLSNLLAPWEMRW